MSAMCHSRPTHRSKQRIQKDRLAAVLPKSSQSVFDQAASAALAVLRRRANAIRPPRAAMMPGSPAPTMGPGTAVNTAMQPNGQKVLAPAAFEPASGTKTSPLNGSTVIECALVVDGRL